MNKRLVRGGLMVAVLLATIGVFSYYIGHHPELYRQLRHTSLGTMGAVLGLYVGAIGSLVLMNAATLRLCGLRLGLRETSLLTVYTTIINFFGPLQSGPAFRAVYLKKRYHISLKNYAKATLAYYGFYASFCILFLLAGILKFWAVLLIAVGVALAIWLSRHKHYLPASWQQLQLQDWYWLAGATFLQLAFMTLVFHTELHSVAPGTTLQQAIIYTGAASLALFVSITPAAIGFRESFLLLSQRLHHIAPSVIVIANVIDRALYIVVLSVLALIVFGSHANRWLQKRIEA